MTTGEWWGYWWSNVRSRFDRINGTLAVVGVATGALALAGVKLGRLSPLGEELVWWIGFAVCCLALLYCAVQVAIARPSYLGAHEAAGRKLSLAALARLLPGCVKVAFVGAGAVGKSTLLHHLVGLEGKPAETKGAELTLFSVAPPVGQLAYLDSAGQDLPQQAEIVDHADLIVLMLDHNEGGIRRVSERRKQSQASSVDHLVSKIRHMRRQGKEVVAVHVLRNKSDLWGGCPAREKENLGAWFAAQLAKVKAVMPNGSVTDDDHWNGSSEDVAKVRDKVMELARLVAGRRAT